MATQYQLVMRSGPTPGTTYSLDGELMTLGRDSTNTIVINDAEVSRRHARLALQGGRIVIEDLGSTNGTFINNQRISGPYVLKSGDMISFGEQIVLAFEALSFDPNATMMSSSSKATAIGTPPVVPPPPAQQYQQPPAYAGQIPAGLPPAAPETGSGSNTKRILIIVAVAIVLIICCCVGFFVLIDQMNLWCSPLTSWLVPILSGGTCP